MLVYQKGISVISHGFMDGNQHQQEKNRKPAQFQQFPCGYDGPLIDIYSHPGVEHG